jgi:hypothetical protein
LYVIYYSIRLFLFVILYRASVYLCRHGPEWRRRSGRPASIHVGENDLREVIGDVEGGRGRRRLGDPCTPLALLLLGPPQPPCVLHGDCNFFLSLNDRGDYVLIMIFQTCTRTYVQICTIVVTACCVIRLCQELGTNRFCQKKKSTRHEHVSFGLLLQRSALHQEPLQAGFLRANKKVLDMLSGNCRKSIMLEALGTLSCNV